MNDPGSSYESAFGAPPVVTASAPGRVNLIGEHTDYNDGFVLPSAIPQRTTVSLGPSSDGRHHLYSASLDERVSAGPGETIPLGFASYVLGCVFVLERECGITVPPINVHIASDVPIGSGLSSSAALEVATLRALRSLTCVGIDDVRLALLAQKAEIEHAGVRCGVMDQMASSLAGVSHMLFLDTRTLERRLLPLPEASEVLVVDSGVPRALASSAYNTRRAECEQAACLLGVHALRDVADPHDAESLPESLRRRARHVVTENLRVLEAASGVSPARFGDLMNASHDSLRDDHEVSSPGLDALVGALRASPGVFGARLTGAGFGGACVALVARGAAGEAGREALARYARSGFQGRLLV